MKIGLYNPENEHSACGTGFVVDSAHIGQPSHKIVELGIQTLQANLHRGATVDGETGDGAGLLTQIPQKLIAEFLDAQGMPHPNGFGVGMLFLPTDTDKRAMAKRSIEKTLAEYGLPILGWREVPCNEQGMSARALRDKPAIEQVIFGKQANLTPEANEQLIHRASAAISDTAITNKSGVYISSMSGHTIVYKGLFRADQVAAFYPDLTNPAFESQFVVYHSRFSTNTQSTWQGAQPFGMVAHNGEINTIQSNQINWMSRIIAEGKVNFNFLPGLSDSGRFNAVLSEYVLAKGYSVPQALIAMMPPAWQNDPRITGEVRKMLEYYSLYQEPFDGPAHMIFTDGDHYIGARLDRGGLRPSRTTIYEDGIITVGSEAGLLDSPERSIARQTSLRAGEMVAVDLHTGAYMDNTALMKQLAEQKSPEKTGRSFPELVKATMVQIPPLMDMLSQTLRRGNTNGTSDLTQEQCQVAYGWHQELIGRYILPMAATGKELITAMGDDTAPAVLSGYKWNLSHYAKQRFAQVTNPPIDSLREADNFSLEVTLGGELSPESDPRAKRARLASPVLGLGAIARIEKTPELAPATLDTTFDVGQGEASMRAALSALCDEAEKQVAAGKRVLILDDSAVGTARGALDPMLATAAVSQHLIDKGLRTKASLVVNSGQVVSAHDLNMVLSCGAAAVCPFMLYREVENQYSAQAPELEGKTLKELEENVAHALEAGVKKTMAKMGICDVKSYIGGMQFEFLGINLNPKDEPFLAHVFQHVESPIQGHGFKELAENALTFHHLAIDPRGGKLPEYGKYNRKTGSQSETHGYGKYVVKPLQSSLGENIHRDGAKTVFVIDNEGNPVASSENMVEPTSTVFGAYLEKIGKGGSAVHQVTIRRKGQPDEVVDQELKPYTPEEINAFAMSDEYRQLKEDLKAIEQQRPSSLSSILSLATNTVKEKTPLNEVQDATSILKQISFGGMSLGAVTEPMHASLALAAYLSGVRSNTGEGGEPAERWKKGDSPLSNSSTAGPLNGAIKQVASGRFGVTAEYLKNAAEIEIKIAQGAKPGEGGQLPKNKVSVQIAIQRRGTPGVELISPPPQHDIYSIEDLAELIYDIRSAQPRIGVKLVSSTGVGTVAVGVSKALLAKGLDADGLAGTINIAGGTGGTGAAQITSIYNAGMPYEIGLSEAHQALRSEGLEDLVHLRTSGAFKTGSDIVKAAILGANEFEFGTTAMIMLKCIMAGTCNTTCPGGQTTDDKIFRGKAEDLAKYMVNVAQDVRETLSALGLKSLEEARGRTDLLTQITHDKAPDITQEPRETRLEEANYAIRASGINLNNMLMRPERNFLNETVRNMLKPTQRIDENFLPQVREFLAGDASSLALDGGALTNSQRAVGGSLAMEICDRLAAQAMHGRRAVAEDAITLKFSGVAGQSFGVWNSHGLSLALTGHAQDGVGKGMSGGVISISPPHALQAKASENTIIGNVGLFGATGGKAFIAGIAGDRFAVRNSGATSVVEGLGDFGCEYMTAGTVVNLGNVGKHFGAGMSGGVAVQYDPDNSFTMCCDHSAVSLYSGPGTEMYLDAVKTLLEEHVRRTDPDGVGKAHAILADWDKEKAHFKVVIPKSLEKIRTPEELDAIRQVNEARGSTSVESVMIKDLLETVQTQLPILSTAQKEAAPKPFLQKQAQMMAI